MLLRVVLLAVFLPLLVSGLTLKEVESMKGCILDNRGCPSGLNYDYIQSKVKDMVSKMPPWQCRCDKNYPSCIRNCYWSYRYRDLMAAAVAGITDPEDQQNAQYKTDYYLKRVLKPCIWSDSQCTKAGLGLNYEIIKEATLRYLKAYKLPFICVRCSGEPNACVRKCYYETLVVRADDYSGYF